MRGRQVWLFRQSGAKGQGPSSSWGFTPYPFTRAIGKYEKIACAAGRECAGLYFLTKWIAAARAILVGCTAPTIGYSAASGWHRLCEHALSNKPIFSGVCKNNRFYRPIIRVSPSAGDAAHSIPRQFCGKHVLCEHVLTAKRAASAACGWHRL